MLDAFYIAAVGIKAQQEQLNAVSNNFANLGTTAFKRQSVDFTAILDRMPASRLATSVNAPDARPNRLVRSDLTVGDVHATGRLLDIAIVGNGFLEVELPDGQTAYTRAGALKINADGVLGIESGQALTADVRIPSDAMDVQVLRDGSVVARLSTDEALTTLGQLELVRFANPESLQYRGEGLYTAPEGGSEPVRARPGEQGLDVLATQSLEGSNVNMTSEMVSLMLMQRVYELNSRVVQVADELMSMANNLRRSG